MNNLIFSLNATMPVFLVMVVGYFLYKFGFTNDEFLKTANRFVFKITLPCLLLMDMMQCDIKKIFDGKYVLSLDLAKVLFPNISNTLLKEILNKGTYNVYVKNKKIILCLNYHYMYYSYLGIIKIVV